MAINRIFSTAIYLPKNDLKCGRPVARQRVLSENLEAEQSPLSRALAEQGSEGKTNRTLETL
jgi:hypothetical protein